MMGYCKQCGIPIKVAAGEAMYCPFCKAKRFRQPVEIDPETGEWEGMSHDV